LNRLDDNALFISALNQENIENLKKKIYEAVRQIPPYNSFLYPEYYAYVDEEKDVEE